MIREAEKKTMQHVDPFLADVEGKSKPDKGKK